MENMVVLFVRFFCQCVSRLFCLFPVSVVLFLSRVALPTFCVGLFCMMILDTSSSLVCPLLSFFLLFAVNLFRRPLAVLFFSYNNGSTSCCQQFFQLGIKPLVSPIHFFNWSVWFLNGKNLQSDLACQIQP